MDAIQDSVLTGPKTNSDRLMENTIQGGADFGKYQDTLNTQSLDQGSIQKVPNNLHQHSI